MQSVVTIEPHVTAPNRRSLLEACFQIKDQDTMLRTLDFIMGQSILDGALSILQPVFGGPKICQLQCNGRSLQLVKANSNRNHNNHYYLCILNNECEYCSCRSFMERCRKNDEPYCKHLLALRLSRVLGVEDAVRVESFPNEEIFSNAVTERLFKDQAS